MRGFLAGSLALIALEVLLRDSAAAKAETGIGLVVALVRRALSPQVAGLPQSGIPRKPLQPAEPPFRRAPDPPSNARPGR